MKGQIRIEFIFGMLCFLFLMVCWAGSIIQLGSQHSSETVILIWIFAGAVAVDVAEIQVLGVPDADAIGERPRRGHAVQVKVDEGQVGAVLDVQGQGLGALDAVVALDQRRHRRVIALRLVGGLDAARRVEALVDAFLRGADRHGRAFQDLIGPQVNNPADLFRSH
jgi:hypothetical protein